MLKNGQQVVPHLMVQASMPLLLQAIVFQVVFAFKTCVSSPALLTGDSSSGRWLFIDIYFKSPRHFRRW
jgi:hypothetical protein